MGYKLNAMAAANKHVSLQMCRSLVGCDAGPHVGVMCVNGCICGYRALPPGWLMSHVSCPNPPSVSQSQMLGWPVLTGAPLGVLSGPWVHVSKTCKVMASCGVGATAVMVVGKFTASV